MVNSFVVSQANINLWYTCLYMGQMSLMHLSNEERSEAFEKLTKVRRDYPLIASDLVSLPLKQRFWAIISAISFKAACELRNILKIGI